MGLITSPDSSVRLHAALDWLLSYPKDAEMIVVAATKEAGDEFVRKATLRSGARFGLARLTLDQLASRLSAPILARQEVVPVGGLSIEAVCARAIFLLTATGELEYFGEVATKPGFPVAFARTFEELRMNRISPEDLTRVSRGGRDLSLLMTKVRQELLEVRLADRAARFEAAIETVKREVAPHPVGLPLMMLDVPISSKLEIELVRELTQQSIDFMVTCPRGDERTLTNVERAFGTSCESITHAPVVSSLQKLKEHLFEDHSPDTVSLDDSVVLNSFPGESREAAEIARRVRREAEQGTPFDQIAVLLRAPNEYRTHLQEAFRRASIPAYFARGTRRPHPAGRAFLALLRCASEGLSARRFSEYLSLSQVPDATGAVAESSAWSLPESDFLGESITGSESVASLGNENHDEDSGSVDQESAGSEGNDISSRIPWRWEQLLVESSVIGGKDRWQRRLEGLENELKVKRQELVDDQEETRIILIDQQIGELRNLKEFALPLIDRLSALPRRANWGEWLIQLRELATFSLREPEEVLSTLVELEPMSPVGPVDLYEIQLVLTPRLCELAVPPPRRRYGAVFVGSTEAARGMSFDVVFTPGLAEKLFPKKIIEDPILLDEGREALKEIAALSTQTDRVKGERLSLRLVVGAANKRIYLSYPRIDVQQARPRVPSFYSLEVLRAAEGQLTGFEELSKRAELSAVARLGWPAPAQPDEAIDEAEYDLALLAPLRGEDPKATTGAAHYLVTANPHLTRALRFRARRWLRRWTIADGLVDPDELAREALARHQLSARSFSATALQHFAACPYKFFLQAVHRLQPREEPVAIEVLDPMTRGSLFHEAQFKVLTLLKKDGSLPITLKNLDEATKHVDSVLSKVAEKYRDQLAPAIPRVWDDTMAQIRADLREWLRRMTDSDEGWVPDRFELSFGLGDRDRPDKDPASVDDPIPVSAGLKLRGSIDLVEKRADGTLRATDNKTGKIRAGKEFVVEGGKALQPILYALALESLLGAQVDSGRLYYCTTDGGYTERVVQVDPFSRSVAEEVVQIIGRALEEGFFPAAPDERACQWCDYRLVCGPREEMRTSRKPKDRLRDLRELRKLR